MLKHQNIEIGLLEVNTGQIALLPANPRFIRSERFDKLADSIKEDNTFLQARGIIVYPLKDKYIIIGGEMRYRACLALNFKEVPCIILPKSSGIDNLRKYAILDNTHAGEFDFEALANDFNADELTDWFLEVPNFEETPKIEQSAQNYKIEYKIVFDNEGHQAKFMEFLQVLDSRFPECSTVSERLDTFITEYFKLTI